MLHFCGMFPLDSLYALPPLHSLTLNVSCLLSQGLCIDHKPSPRVHFRIHPLFQCPMAPSMDRVHHNFGGATSTGTE